jgi:cobyrinic acid a,c-diamide synthase
MIESDPTEMRLISGGAEPSAFVIAGTHSGVGKTTVTLALLSAIAARGYRVQPFKIGPDFIDTAYHSEIAGRASVNLDLWMMGADKVKKTFSRYCRHADVALIEGMGALYDGENGTARGSAAALSKLIGARIVLVIDIWGMTRSAHALLKGFLSFDSELDFAGFVMNRAGSEQHAEMVRRSLSDRLRALCLGYVLHRSSLAIPERHLGLVTVDENPVHRIDRAAAFSAAHQALDVDRLLPSANSYSAPRPTHCETPPNRVRIAIARDPAFSFYYAENLDALEEAGAELCPFSPTVDPHLPMDVAGVYIGGGYPESFATELASNETLKEQLQQLTMLGMPVYAECGGFMYLGRTLTDFGGGAKAMAGVFPIDTVMDQEHLAIRYVTVSTLADSPLGPTGTKARGQEFHQSRFKSDVRGVSLYSVMTANGEHCEEGLLCNNAAGSYIHLHFASNPDIPHNFVRSCHAWQQKQAIL